MCIKTCHNCHYNYLTTCLVNGLPVEDNNFQACPIWKVNFRTMEEFKEYHEADDPILDFIHRRFSDSTNEHWTNGNCYFFALILNEVFVGEIVYDQINGHFMFYSLITGLYYDFNGAHNIKERKYIKSLEYIRRTDPALYGRLRRDCIL